MNRNYVLFASTGVGLGHLLSALMSTAYYAWRTGSILALDMREVHFFASNNHDAFFSNFTIDFPSDMEVVTDLAMIDQLSKEPDLHYLRLEDRLDVDKPFPNKVLMVPCISPGEPFRRGYRAAEAKFQIHLRGPLREALDKALAMPQWNSTVIGLHYRATVGELFDRMTKLTVPDYDERYARIMDEYVSTALKLREDCSDASVSFLVASDDRDFIREMKSRLPNSFSLSTRLLDREFAAYVREHNFDISILMDAVVDLWCLSNCAQLIHSRSAFSHFAIVNSPKLDDSNTHYVHMPLFDEILDSVSPETAVAWAREAVRKVEISRMHYDKSHWSLVRALERAGRMAEIEPVRQRATWHWEVTQSPDIDGPEIFETRALERSGGHDALLSRLEKKIEKIPGNPFLLSGYGGSMVDLLTRLGRFDEALAPAHKAVAMAPDDPFLQNALGVALLRANQTDEAETYLRNAISLDAKVASFYADLADCLTKLQRTEEAIEQARIAIALDPTDSVPHMRMSEAFLNAGFFSEAENAILEAIELNPRDPGYYHRLSIALERQGRFEDAINASKQGANADPRQSYSLERVATLKLNLGDAVGAEEAARLAINVQPNKAQTYHIIYDALLKQNRLNDAAEAMRTALELAPLDPENHARASIAFLKASQYEAAESSSRRAIELDPSNSRLYQQLATSLERQGRYDASHKTLKQAEEIDPESKSIKDQLSHLATLASKFRKIDRLVSNLDSITIDLLSHNHGDLMFSAFGEDGVLWHLLRNIKDGFYVDIGANHPVRLSNTARLHYYNGWTGINVDADSRYIEEFNLLRPNDINICCGVGAENGVAKMAIFLDGAINSFDTAEIEKSVTKGGRQVSEMREIPIRTLRDILSSSLPHGRSIDLLNIDAEGWDTLILNSNDWSKYRPSLILVEDHSMLLTNVNRSSTYKLLCEQNYELFSQTLATSFYRPVGS